MVTTGIKYNYNLQYILYLNVASIQLLNCKNGWTSGNLDYLLQFLTVYILFSLLFKLVF